VIYIDQPVGVGLSPGVSTVNDETDVADQFRGFWKNFIETFCMEGYKVYITGESYAGQYVSHFYVFVARLSLTKYRFLILRLVCSTKMTL
jgi:carboxypeptidase D